MLFNSYSYIFVFLPLTLLLYTFLNKNRLVVAGKVLLVGASLFFYGFWNPAYLLLIIISILMNFGFGNVLIKFKENGMQKRAKVVLIFGIFLNLDILGYYKYTDFFIANINDIFGFDISLLRLVLPLAISFFTFQQIAYLVDSYKGVTKEYDFLNYVLFVTFFPQLIAGPIVHHKEMMPQFADVKTKIFSSKNLSIGIYIFSIGLFKKVMIADSFAGWANLGFENAGSLSFFEAWFSSLCYTFQLYFDFSGYTDMAVGSALMFNIKLPLNFNSPYKALNIQDFWRRWHMTLSRWLRDYLYIPMGGNKKGEFRTYINLFLTFLLGGFWHGAGWTFLIWGAMHGLGTAGHKFWQSKGFRMNKYLAWLTTFLFVNFAWVFFRAANVHEAVNIIKGMFGLNGINIPVRIYEMFPNVSMLGITAHNWLGLRMGEIILMCVFVVVFGIASFWHKNSMEMNEGFKPTTRTAVFISFCLVCGIFGLSRVTEFIYFQF